MQCEGHNCNAGDEIWIEPCRPDLPEQQLFEWIPIPDDLFATSSFRVSRAATQEWGLLQSGWDHTADFSQRLCLERVGSRYYKLQYCEMGEYRQWFRGFDLEGPFELNSPPKDQPTRQSTSSSCLTMPHHPRHFEHIYHASCNEARGDSSSQWYAVYGKKNGSEPVFHPETYYRLGNKRTDPRCTEVTKCGMCQVSLTVQVSCLSFVYCIMTNKIFACQGHCENDKQCEGSLKCFERRSGNPTETPPGCYGRGVPRKYFLLEFAVAVSVL